MWIERHTGHGKGLPLRKAISPGGRYLFGAATYFCHHFRLLRAIQATADCATRTIRRPSSAYLVPGRSSGYAYPHTYLTVTYANPCTVGDRERNTYTWWDPNDVTIQRPQP